MICAIAYIVIGLGTALVLRDVSFKARAGALVVWPLYWFVFFYGYIVGIAPAKCAWCGETVTGHADKAKWRAHYLDVCGRHPLALRLKEYETLMDELDAKHTEKRVALEAAYKQIAALEAELRPWREMNKTILQRMEKGMYLDFFRGNK